MLSQARANATPVEIILLNKTGDRRKVLAALEAFASAQQLPAEIVQALDLALEEHLTNVFKHGYADEGVHEIRVRFGIESGSVTAEIEDDGRPFNPLSAPEVNTSVPLQEKPVGGLGIHLMRCVMDEIEYHRGNGHNILRMRKKLCPRPT